MIEPFYYDEFSRAYKNYLFQVPSGNIADFKKWLSEQDGDTLLKFIKWLQAEGLRL